MKPRATSPGGPPRSTRLAKISGKDSARDAPGPSGKGSGKAVRDAGKYDSAFEKVYRIVLRIPHGKVVTYGHISRMLGGEFSARFVGWAMHATPKDGRNIPWHRVINSKGETSTGRVIPSAPDMQKWMLEAEGVVFDARGKCDLDMYHWRPRVRSKAAGAEILQNKSKAKTAKKAAQTRAKRGGGK